MFKVLLRKQLMETFSNYFYDRKTGKKRSKASIIGMFLLFFVLIVGFVGGITAVTSFSIADQLLPYHLDWLYYVIQSVCGLALGTVGSAFTTYSSLYLGKDNDLLISMPIPVGTIVASRLTNVYLMGLLFSGVVTIPSTVVYCILTRASAMQILCGILNILLVSLLVLVLSCLLGWVVAKLSGKFKRKSFLSVIVSLLVLVLYFGFINKAQTYLESFLSQATAIGAQIEQSLPVLFVWGRMGAGDAISASICLVCTCVLCALTWLLLSKTFLKMATATDKAAHVEYREKKVAVKSVSAALTRKEFRRFTCSAGYMLNSGFGSLLLMLAAIALLVLAPVLSPKMNELLSGLLGGESIIKFGMLPGLFCAVLCLIGSTVMPATPSVSLEGKNIWIAQSLPVTPWQALKAKLNVQLWLLGLPLLLCGIGGMLLLPFSVESALMLPLIASFVLMFSLIALALGLRKPNLNWTNENVVVKQSFNVFLIMLIGFAYAFLLGAGCVFGGMLLGTMPVMLIAIAVTLLIALLVYKWLRGRGCGIFASL